MERVLVHKPDAAASSSAIVETNKDASASSDDDDDSDDEIGRMIYNSSETAKARAAAVEAERIPTLFPALQSNLDYRSKTKAWLDAR